MTKFKEGIKMSIVGFLLKPKKEMAKKGTRYVKVGKYYLTSHAQNRIVQKERTMDKVDVLDNLFTKPNAITQVKYNKSGKPSYDRVGKRITTSINPTNNYVATCRPVSKKEIKQFVLTDIGKGGKRKYVKQESRK